MDEKPMRPTSGRGIHDRPVIALVVWSIVCGASATNAADIQWNGGTSDSWNLVQNWDPFGSPFSTQRVPGDGDTANLLSPAGDVVRLYANTAPINGLIIGNGIELHTNSKHLSIDNDGLGTLGIGGANTRLVVGNGGNEDVGTDSLLITGGGELYFAESGVVRVDGNTSLFSGGKIRKAQGSTAFLNFYGNLTLDAGILELLGTDHVSFAPNKTILARNNSLVRIDDTIGLPSGTVARFESGSVLIVDSDMVIGQGATVEIIGATLEPTNGNLTVDGGVLRLGEGEVFIPTLDLGDQGHLRAINNAQVYLTTFQFIDKNAVFEITSGADLFNSLTQYVGDDDGDGTLLVSGLGSSLTSPELRVGRSGTGEAVVTIDQSAEANVEYLSLGFTASPGETNFARLRVENGAAIHVAEEVVVGNTVGSDAALIVRDGASLSHTGTAPTRIRSSAGGRGEVLVSDGGSYASSDGNFTIHEFGRFAVTGGDAAGFVEINGALSVQGTLSVDDFSGVSGVLVARAPATVDGGVLALEGGVLRADSVGIVNSGQFNFSAGRLTVGVLGGNLTVPAGGTLAPGPVDSDSGGGTTSITGTYFQQPGSTLELEIGGGAMGTGYDFVNVGSSAVVDGELNLSLINGFVPSPTSAFTVFNAASLLGSFDNVANGARLNVIGGEGSFLVHYGVGSAFDPKQIVLSDFLATGVPGDFDNDGDVDGRDFLVWQRDASVGDLVDWQGNYGAGSLSASAAVPEPSCLALALLAQVCCRLRFERNRCKR